VLGTRRLRGPIFPSPKRKRHSPPWLKRGTLWRKTVEDRLNTNESTQTKTESLGLRIPAGESHISEEKGRSMLRCPKCESELPESAKFCSKCGFSQTNPLLMAIPRVQKDIRISDLDKEQIPVTPHLNQDYDVLPTAKVEAVRPVKTNKPTRNGTAAHRALAPSLKARFIPNTKPLYIGRVVSVGKKPSRRNLLLTRAGLYLTLAIITCLIITASFIIIYTLSQHPH